MPSQMPKFESREGGPFSISPIYDRPSATGKTRVHTDTNDGRNLGIVPYQQLVETVMFETFGFLKFGI